MDVRNAIIQYMRFRLDSLLLSVIITALMIIVLCDVLLYTGCLQNLPFLVSSRSGGTAWTWTVMLKPALVSAAMICCVAYMDQIHLCGTDDATAGLICLVFPSPSFQLTLFCASFCLSSCNLLTSAFRGLLLLQIGLHLLLFKNLHSLAYCS